ncbi:MAG: hypothetical protein JXA98_02805 [Methanosarcinaceae archaeon]|nr:hypothetical protein [Methanosarcinaceae archaeon]
MKNQGTIAVMFLIIFSVLSLTAISGCLETPEATPARVSSDALSRYGWAQVGEVAYESNEIPISNITTISINTATTTYQDNELANDIVAQINDFQKSFGINTGIEVPYVGSQLITIRMALPAGIELPSNVTAAIIDSQIENIGSQNNIEDFKKTENRLLAIDDDSVAAVNTYAGTLPMDGASIDIIGIVALWPSSNTNIIAIGVVPDGEVNLKLGAIEKTLFKVNGDEEIAEVVDLIKTIE